MRRVARFKIKYKTKQNKYYSFEEEFFKLKNGQFKNQFSFYCFCKNRVKNILESVK